MYSAVEFGRLTGWAIEPAKYARVATALSFYYTHVPPSHLYDRVRDPGPWTLKIGGITTNLCILVQAIDYEHPVHITGLLPGRRLLAYRTAADRGLGSWFTEAGTPPSRLAIAGDQISTRTLHVTAPTWALCSTVSDNYVDWARHRGNPPKYKHGSGRQFFIWNAGRSLSTHAHAPGVARR